MNPLTTPAPTATLDSIFGGSSSSTANPQKTSTLDSIFKPVQLPSQATQTMEKSIGDSEKNNPLDNLSEGVAKGELGTVKGIGSLGQKFLDQTAGRVVNATQGKGFTPTSEDNIYNSDSDSGKNADAALAPVGFAQKAGHFAEQAAELALPGKVAEEATKGLSLLGDASKFSDATKIFVNSLPKAAADTLATLGVVSARDGSVDKDALTSALFSGTLDTASAGGKAIIEKYGPDLAARMINSIIKPLKGNLSYGKNPGRAVAQEGIVATSLDDLGEKIGTALTSRVQQLNEMVQKYTDAGHKLDLTKATTPIDDALAEAQKAPNTNASIITRLQGLKDDLLGITRDEEGSVTSQSNLSNHTPNQAVDFKRFIGKLTKFTGNPSDDKTVNAALQRVYGAVKESIEKLDPANNELKNLNAHIADLISADKATEYRSSINERQNMVSLGDTATGALGSLVGLLHGGAPEAIVAGLAATGAKKALGSTLVKTGIAKWLMSATPAEKSLLLNAVPWAKDALKDTLLEATTASGPSNQ